ncbi:MAG: ABC transporter ATP-binding protein, partial [Planctomycetota bacterium]
MIDKSNILLSIKNLSTHFQTEQGLVRAVQDVSFDIPAGKTLAVVGESGCGKSVTALSVMQLIPYPPGKIVEGEVVFDGESLLDASESRMRQIRGNEIAMIFQEPMTSLNPVFTVGNQIVEAVKLHQKKSGSQARDMAVDMMRKVGIADPQRRVAEY